MSLCSVWWGLVSLTTSVVSFSYSLATNTFKTCKHFIKLWDIHWCILHHKTKGVISKVCGKHRPYFIQLKNAQWFLGFRTIPTVCGYNDEVGKDKYQNKLNSLVSYPKYKTMYVLYHNNYVISIYQLPSSTVIEFLQQDVKNGVSTFLFLS